MGNMQFMGHLYHNALLTKDITIQCIKQLLDAPIAEELECVCKRLRTVGADLEVRPKVVASGCEIP
jgi:hypothetical protein